MTVEVRVRGRRLSGFQRGDVSLSLESMTASFGVDFVAPDGLASADDVMIEGDAALVLVDDVVVISGYVDTFDGEDEPGGLRLRASGRSRTADLVDCSAEHRAFRGLRVGALVREIAAQAKVDVEVLGDQGEPFSHFVAQRGETAGDAIARAAGLRGLHAYAVGDKLRLARAGAERTETRLSRGREPLISMARSCSWYQRYSHYVFRGQVRATDALWGKAASQLKSSVLDEAITRYRPLLVQVQTHGQGDLRTRATVLKNQRAGKGERVVATVLGHKTMEGLPWRPNLLVDVRNPVLDVDATLLVSSVKLRFSEGGPDTSELELMRPEAYDVGNYKPLRKKVRW